MKRGIKWRRKNTKYSLQQIQLNTIHMIITILVLLLLFYIKTKNRIRLASKYVNMFACKYVCMRL